MSLAPIEEGLKHLLSPRVADGEPCARSLYQYAAGELGVKEAEAFEAHLDECEICRGDLAAFRETGKEAPGRASWWPRPAWVAAAAALVVCVLALALWWFMRSEEQEPAFRIKGPCQIKVAVQRGDRRFVGVSGSTFHTGDILGFFYTAPEEGYLVVFFSDEQGRITRAFPAGPPVRMPAGIERPLPDGAVLEPGEGCEWIVAFFSNELPDMDNLGELLRQAVQDRKPDCTLGPMDLQGVSTHAVILRREP